jgi:hypothetical protein
MGYQNQALVRQTAKRYRLTNVEEKVLDTIALMSLDEVPEDPRPPRLYFAGWVALAERLNLTDPISPNARRYVARILRSLVAKGALEHVEQGYRGHRAVWRLAVTLIPAPVDNAGKGGQHVHPIPQERGVNTSTQRGVNTSTKGGSTRPPKGGQGSPLKEQGGTRRIKKEDPTRVRPDITSDRRPVDRPRPVERPTVTALLKLMDEKRKAKGGR